MRGIIISLQCIQCINVMSILILFFGCTISRVQDIDMLLVVYSTTDRRSFELSSQMLTMIVFNYKRINPDVAILLVGNKSDLVRARCVDTDEGNITFYESPCYN